MYTTDKGDNLDRYLMGRQFMVIFINFTINLCGSPLAGADAFGMPQIIQDIFLGSGIAMVLVVVTIGQLTAQVNASHCMLDYINTHFMTFTLWVTLAIEMTGFMHACYLIQMAAYKLAGKPVESNEAPRTGLQAAFFWGRCLMSCAVLIFSLAVTMEALFGGRTTMWDGVPGGVSVLLFVLLMSVVGMLEGMQIAFFAVTKLPEAERGNAPFAVKVCNLLFEGGGRNLPGFMVGRQLTVTLCFFVIARVTTITNEIGVDENIFGVSDPIQKLFNLGFLGALITTILASISWQLVASAFPVQFLSNPLVYVLLKIALALEATGICAGAWFLAIIHKKIAGFQRDEVYVGTAEERAEAAKNKDPTLPKHEIAEAHLGTVGFLDHLPKEWIAKFENGNFFPERRNTILANISNLRELISSAESPDEKHAYETALKLEVAALKKLNEEEQSIRDLSKEGDLELGTETDES
jgi:silicon transporter